jgi:ATPase subunit of ABC transporter with duplicated ATPase domains
LLVLDEPTNDFDTDMLAALEDLLDGWPGTLLVISHDRYFLERVTDTQFALLGDGKLRHLPRGVTEYLELRAAAANQPNRSPMLSKMLAGQPEAGGSITGAERRELEKKLGRLERSLAKLEQELVEIDGKLLAAPTSEFQVLQQLAEQRERASLELRSVEQQWVETAEMLEA